jgi:hypothetical protein
MQAGIRGEQSEASNRAIEVEQRFTEDGSWSCRVEGARMGQVPIGQTMFVRSLLPGEHIEIKQSVGYDRHRLQKFHVSNIGGRAHINVIGMR